MDNIQDTARLAMVQIHLADTAAALRKATAPALTPRLFTIETTVTVSQFWTVDATSEDEAESFWRNGQATHDRDRDYEIAGTDTVCDVYEGNSPDNQ